MRELDDEDRAILAKVHQSIGEKTVESLINGIIQAGGTFGDLIQLLESVNAAVFLYIFNNSEESGQEAMVLETFKYNILVRMQNAKQAEVPELKVVE